MGHQGAHKRVERFGDVAAGMLAQDNQSEMAEDQRAVRNRVDRGEEDRVEVREGVHSQVADQRVVCNQTVFHIHSQAAIQAGAESLPVEEILALAAGKMDRTDYILNRLEGQETKGTVADREGSTSSRVCRRI